MQLKLKQGERLPAVMQSERVWSNRTSLVSRALNTHTIQSLEILLHKSAGIDQAVKGMHDASPWDELSDIVIGLANKPLALQRSSSLV